VQITICSCKVFRQLRRLLHQHCGRLLWCWGCCLLWMLLLLLLLLLLRCCC
jgi:hypothetical protein